MNIEFEDNTIRIWLDERYAILKWKDLDGYWLEEYAFGKDYMPYEIYYSTNLYETYKRYTEVKR